MRLTRGRSAALASAVSALLAPAAASAVGIAPVETIATGGGLVCPAGVDAVPFVFVADPCAHRLFTVDLQARRATATVGTGINNTASSDNIPHPTAVAGNGIGRIYFLDNPPSTMVLVPGRLRSYSIFDSNQAITDSGVTTGVGLAGLSITPFDTPTVGYFAASETSVIRNLDGTQVAGNQSQTGSLPPQGGDPLAGSIGIPLDTAVNKSDSAHVYFSSHFASGSDRVFRVTNAGAINAAIVTVVGGNAGPNLGDGGPPTSAWLDNPTSVVSLRDGGLLVYDAGHARIRRVSGNGTTIDTIVGNGTTGTAADGTPAAAAPLQAAGDMTVGDDGLVFSQPAGGVIQMIPAAAIASGPSDFSASNNAAFSFSSWDSAASFTCNLDDQNGSVDQPCGPYVALAEGRHTLRYQAHADDQSLSSYPLSRTWTVDTVAPSAFGLIAPADGAGGLHVATPFSWQPAPDATSGVDRYELWIDGAKARELAPAACTETCTLTPPDLPEAGHTWQVKAIDKAGNTTASETRSFTVAVPPAASLVLAPARAIVGRPVTLDASGSTDEGSGIVRYEFDTDGDGKFETDAGSVKTTTRSYPAPRTITVAVRTTDAAGLASVASAQLTVTATPPAGKQLGVSIDDGAQFTNDPNVTVNAVWPSFASDMLFSNDGGFKAPGHFPVAASTPWKLDSSGPERLPKTIYVRFLGGLQTSETFQDDIILDQTPPKVLDAALAPPAVAATAVAAKARLVTLKVKAKDNVSGVGKMQVTSSKRRPGRLLKYKRSIKVKPAKVMYVRVRDKAGNYSRWRDVKRG